MVIYSPVPVELLVFSGEQRKFKELKIGGTSIVAEEDSMGVCRIVRVVSTDPYDYLNPLLQPGCEIEYEPVLKGRK